mmetsp:Transcript_30489/g.81314  ORF Transcript_30489/g.81314 Transcript_30489/m.81314 type:complete len:311 (+) Transcript_30489:72-1004(+)
MRGKATDHSPEAGSMAQCCSMLPRSSSGMKESTTRERILICLPCSRMMSSRSSFSAWNSRCRSLTSDRACSYLPHSFFSLRALACASSWMLAYFSSKLAENSSFSRSWLLMRSFSASCSSSSRCARSSSSAFSRAFSASACPTTSFSCMALSCAASRSRSLRSLVTASSRFRTSSSARCRSSSRMFSALAISASWASSLRLCSSSCLSDMALTCLAAFPGPPAALDVFFPLRWSGPVAGEPGPSASSGPSSSSSSSSSCSSSAGAGMVPAFCCSSMDLSRLISSWNSRSMASLGSSLILGLFLMFLARLA